jgi:hypothetical protein
VSKREDEKYEKWVEELSKQVDEDEKEDFEKWSKTNFAKESYRGYLREQEFYRKLNELTEKTQKLEETKTELQEWFDAEKPKNAALIRERDELKSQLEELGVDGPPPAAAPTGLSLSAEKLAELEAKAAKVDVLDRLIPAALGEMSLVLKDSIKNNFDIDPREVIKLSLEKSIEPYRAYEILTADERQKRHEAEREAEKKKWFEEGRRSAQATPSPDHLQPSGPSVLDYLAETNKDASKSVGDRTSRIASALKELSEGDFSA